MLLEKFTEIIERATEIEEALLEGDQILEKDKEFITENSFEMELQEYKGEILSGDEYVPFSLSFKIKGDSTYCYSVLYFKDYETFKYELGCLTMLQELAQEANKIYIGSPLVNLDFWDDSVAGIDLVHVTKVYKGIRVRVALEKSTPPTIQIQSRLGNGPMLP